MFSKSFYFIISFFTALVLVCYRPAISFSNIKFLPGFSDSLPFKLETGYIGVGDVEYFYYFIESERYPANDPLLLWLTGGPGCTALSGLFFEIGPLQFNMAEYNGSLPTFTLNPYSWTKVASIIFLDSPVGTGFSYSRTFEGYKTRDTKFVQDGYNFMRKWLHSHPKFITNPLYIAGDSYAGKIVPMIAQAIGIEDKVVPPINLRGYLVGNPLTDKILDLNSKVPFYHRTTLIPDELYESAKRNCREEYIEVDINNLMCAQDLEAISKCTSRINGPHILEPKCPSDFDPRRSSDSNRKYLLETHEDYKHESAKFPQFGCHSAKSNCREEYADIDISNLMCAKDPEAILECPLGIYGAHISKHKCPSDSHQVDNFDNNRKSLLKTQEDYLHGSTKFPVFGCRNYVYYLCLVWATDVNVQKALHIRKGTVKEWVRCNGSLTYDKDVGSVVNYHLHLNTKGFRALIYSGDHDSDIPYVGTESWIKSLNLSVVDDWRPWFVDGQVGGYLREFQNNFTFATVKGAGHTAPEYKPKECFAMFRRWISLERL